MKTFLNREYNRRAAGQLGHFWHFWPKITMSDIFGVKIQFEIFVDWWSNYLVGDFGEEDHSRIERFQIDLLHVDLITCADFHATIRIVKQILFEDH